MNITIESKYVKRLITAWNLYTTLEVKSEKSEVSDCLYFFPLIGAGIGGVVCLFVYLINSLSGAIPAVILTALAFPIFIYYLNSGRNINSLFKIMDPLLEAFFSDDEDADNFSLFGSKNIVVILFLFKILTVALFVHSGQMVWLFIVPVLSASTYAELLILAGAVDPRKIKKTKYLHWVIALLIAAYFVGATGTFCVAAVWFFCNYAFKYLQGKFGTFDEKMLYGLCEVSEFLTLLIGLLLINK